jgi:hypothetical protein
MVEKEGPNRPEPGSVSLDSKPSVVSPTLLYISRILKKVFYVSP